MLKHGKEIKMELKSQKMRELAPELDPLRIGTGWKKIYQSLRYLLKVHMVIVIREADTLIFLLKR